MRGGWIRRMGLACLGGFVLAGIGCDSAQMLPPQPKALKSASNAASGTKAKELVVVFPGDDSLEYRIWEQLARIEAGREKVTYRVFRPDAAKSPADQATEQAKFVKEAVAQGATGIIILPMDPKGIAQTLADAEAKKATVIVLNRGVKKPGSTEDFRLIRPAGNLDYSKRIVDAVLDDMRREKVDPKAKAILVSDQTEDPVNLERSKSFEEVARKSGLNVVKTLVVKGETTDTQKQLLEAVRAVPDVQVVLADGDLALNAAVTVRSEGKGTYKYLIGGYTSSKSGMDIAALGQVSALVERNLGAQVRKAVVTATTLMRGETLPKSLEPEYSFKRGANATTFPKIFTDTPQTKDAH